MKSVTFMVARWRPRIPERRALRDAVVRHLELQEGRLIRSAMHELRVIIEDFHASLEHEVRRLFAPDQRGRGRPHTTPDVGYLTAELAAFFAGRSGSPPKRSKDGRGHWEEFHAEILRISQEAAIARGLLSPEGVLSGAKLARQAADRWRERSGPN